jgi:rare lipoprotein A
MRKIYYIIISLFILSFGYYNGKIEGTASYYGKTWTGRKTSSGELFHCDSLTAAHKTLKFGTRVKVRNLVNDSVCIVKINDRLPQSSTRVIDLSYGAAVKLNFIRRGIVPVSLEIL